MAKSVHFLMYHQVGLFANPTKHRASFCHVDRFRSHMAYLKYAGYHVISMDEAYAGLYKGNVLPNKSVVLTFDDGCDNFREYAFPILKKYEYPSIVYLIAGMLGKTTTWLNEAGYDEPLMTAEAVKSLQNENVLFGSHTMNHVKLHQSDLSTAREEIFQSKSDLESLLGYEVKHFCYPYGGLNDDVVKLVYEAGYHSAVTCDRGIATTANTTLRIPRKAISYGDNVLGYAWKLLKRN